MNASAHRKYLATLAFFALLCFLFTAAFNAAVDPFRVFDTVRLKGMSRSRAVHHLRATLAYRARRVRPVSLALGSSRMARRAFCARMPAPCMSLPIPQTTAYETRRYFEHANQIRPVRTVVWGLDFPAFNSNRPPAAPGFREDRLAARSGGRAAPCPAADILSMLISRDATRESLLTLGQNDTSARYALMKDVLTGIGEPTPRRVIDAYEPHTTRSFLQSLAAQGLFPPPACGFSTSQNDVMMHNLKMVLDIAAHDKIDVKLFFSPDHAYILETYKYLGLWDEYEMWMRNVVRLAESARRRGARVALWDFSGCNGIATDPVPHGGVPMVFHYDISHYRNNVAALVMDTMLRRNTAARRAHPDFGVEITMGNIEERIKQNRLQCAAYSKKHAAELVPIKSMLRKKIKQTHNKSCGEIQGDIFLTP